MHRHFPDENRHSFFLEFNNDYNLQSMLVFSYHVAIIPFSWNLVLINCQNMMNCVEIILFDMLT